MAYTVEVDKDTCISSGRCVADYPAAFAFDPDELSEPLPGAADLTDAERLDAARNCPSEAITVRDEAGEEVDPFST